MILPSSWHISFWQLIFHPCIEYRSSLFSPYCSCQLYVPSPLFLYNCRMMSCLSNSIWLFNSFSSIAHHLCLYFFSFKWPQAWNFACPYTHFNSTLFQTLRIINPSCTFLLDKTWSNSSLSDYLHLLSLIISYVHKHAYKYSTLFLSSTIQFSGSSFIYVN